jgi:uncharacterized membrane-anchored protein
MEDQFFGKTIGDTIRYFRFHLDGKKQRSKSIKVWSRLVVSLILLIISVFLMATGNQEYKAIPPAIIGAIIGYWLN